MRKLRLILNVIVIFVYSIDAGLLIYKGIEYCKTSNNVEIKKEQKVVKENKTENKQKTNDKDKTTEKEDKKDAANSTAKKGNTNNSDNKETSKEKTDTSKSTEKKSSNSSSDTKKSSKKNSIAGTYDLIDLVDDAGHYEKERIDSLVTMGYKAYMDIKEDNKGTMYIFLVTTEFTYDDNNFYIGENHFPYSIENNQLKFEDNVSKMLFQKRQN